jgi:hypothetical protein
VVEVAEAQIQHEIIEVLLIILIDEMEVLDDLE